MTRRSLRGRAIDMKPRRTAGTLYSAMECPVTKSLFDDYARATTEYVEAADQLSSLAGSHEHFSDAQQLTEQTHAKCRSARLALEKHRIEHDCGITAAGKS
jgi:hypothetical protein